MKILWTPDPRKDSRKKYLSFPSGFCEAEDPKNLGTLPVAAKPDTTIEGPQSGLYMSLQYMLV